MRRDAGGGFNLVMALALASVGGCAGTELPQTNTISSPDPATGGYRLSPKEAAMDCRALNGRMQLALLDTRGYVPGVKGPSIGQSIQNGFAAIFDSTKATPAPDARYAVQRQKLEAYNAALAAQSCPTFDLDRELLQTDYRVSPQPLSKQDAEKRK